MAPDALTLARPSGVSGPTGPAQPRVALAMPCVDWMWTRAAQALIGVLLRSGPGLRLMMPTSGTTIAEKRNLCVRKFLAGPEEWLLFLDSDMTPPPDVIPRLIRHQLPIVGALCFGRRPPFVAAAGHWRDGQLEHLSDFKANALVSVDVIGTGCVLLHRRVLETLDAPRADDSAPLGPWFKADTEGAAEDVAFCRLARAAGFEIWVDTSTVVGHLGVQSIDLDWLLQHGGASGT